MAKFKPQHRLDFVDEQLKNDLKTEVFYRALIHQIYYAGFNQLRYENDNRLFFISEEKINGFESHKALIEAFGDQIKNLSSNDPRIGLLNKIYKNMNRAKRLRIDADYSLDCYIEKGIVNSILRDIKQVFSSLEEYE
ncbi:hypothetical protein MMP66_13285 [Acinetobacter dispersus]|uniref:hypothetical protein n=1 Tax=Acinetobacter dispersus TaxID=70348 RepID=UPI001F4A96A2|nr:hypothetical protein [Acinetobacter dispersus]MCH7395235.1 hypothetical protein [Acinetobacter dispersus]